MASIENAFRSSTQNTLIIPRLGITLLIYLVCFGFTAELYADTKALKKQIYETKLHYAETLKKLRSLDEDLIQLKNKTRKRIFRVDGNSYRMTQVDTKVLTALQGMRSELMAAAHQYGNSLGKLSALKSSLSQFRPLADPLGAEKTINIVPSSGTARTNNEVINEYDVLLKEFQKLQNHYKGTLVQLQKLEKSIDADLRKEGAAEIASLDVSRQINSGLGVKVPGSASVKTKQTARYDPKRDVSGLPKRRSVKNNRKFTFEVGSEYKRYDRSRLTLNGFLALDAIFLGDIAVENVASDTFTVPLNFSYGVTPNLVLFSQAPFIKRSTTYSKGGVNGASTQTTTATVDQEFEPGDISVGLSYKLFNDVDSGRSLSWGFIVTAPTGNDPYGIPVKVIEEDEEGLTQFSVPESLPTGSGMWSVKNSLTVLKSADPAVLFANIGYTHNLKQRFSDLDSNPEELTAGDLDLGNSLDFGFGLAFGLNQSTSVSFALNSRISKEAKSEVVTNGVRQLQTIDGSDAKAATLDLGLNYAFSKRLSMASNVGVGLTDDAADFVIGVKFPYSF